MKVPPSPEWLTRICASLTFVLAGSVSAVPIASIREFSSSPPASLTTSPRAAPGSNEASSYSIPSEDLWLGVHTFNIPADGNEQLVLQWGGREQGIVRDLGQGNAAVPLREALVPVPDGGQTLTLLGMAVIGVAAGCRRLSKARKAD